MSGGNTPQSSSLSFNRLLRIAFFTAVFTVLAGLLMVYQHEPTRVWISTGVNYIGYGASNAVEYQDQDAEVDTIPTPFEPVSSLPEPEVLPIPLPLPQPPSAEEVIDSSETSQIKSEEEKEALILSTLEPPPPTPSQPPSSAVVFLPRPVEPSNRTLVLSKLFKKSQKSFWTSIKKTVGCPSKYIKLTGGKNKWDDGGKWTCGLKQIGNTPLACDSSKPCALFSFGVKGNSFFEAEVLAKTCCNIYAYDPSDTKIGKPILPSNPRVKFQQLAVGKEDVNYTKKFKTMMEENGYEWVDVVKMDIEGWEYTVLESVMEDFDKIPIGMLLVEFHADEVGKILDTFDKLERKGMRLFHAEINPYFPNYACEYSFINVNAEYDFLAELINLEY
ncbi:unnamed protein product [Orchesella dallaii]|uniref:Methyltransferase domain-containing protein n=1 Tax=Orchesella dallaii TaxID=48710 RepID=A0ABP1QZR7_9HEXA